MNRLPKKGGLFYLLVSLKLKMQNGFKAYVAAHVVNTGMPVGR